MGQIQISDARLTQLKALANARGIAATEVIETVIQDAQLRGEVDDIIPGIGIAAVSGKVLFTLRDAPPFLMRATSALALSEIVTRIVSGEMKNKRLDFEGGHTLAFARQGGGYRIFALDAHGKTIAAHPLTVRLALDLSRQIEDAAVNAAAHTVQ